MGDITTGTCLTMCPMKEIEMRQRENLLHRFEMGDGYHNQLPRADISRCIKEYRRPTVGNQEVNTEELRPANILLETVNYLIDKVSVIKTNWSDIYDFMFDRLRSVRQDMVIQDIKGPSTVEILEKAVRFHIYSDYRLCVEHAAVYDAKINREHTLECIKRLLNLYRRSPVPCVNRPEFEATYLLFNLGDKDAIKHFYSLDEDLRNNICVRRAYNLSCSYLLNNWVRVVRSLRHLNSPVHLCSVHRHFPGLQRKILFTLNTAFSSKNLKFPLEKITELLALNTPTEAQQLCEKFGITIIETSAQFLKSSFNGSEKIERTHSDFISRQLRKHTIPDILHGHHGNSGDTEYRDLCQQFSDSCQT